MITCTFGAILVWDSCIVQISLGMSLWKSISRCKDLFERFVRFKVGFGEDIRF